MEFLNQLADILANNWEKVLVILSTPIVSGIALWKIGAIFVKIIQNFTAKKYTARQKEYTDRIEKTINDLKVSILAEVKDEIRTINTTFNELEAKTQEKRQAIYNDIFGTKMEVQEIVQDIVSDVKEEVQEIEQELPELEEETKKVDLL